MLGYPRRCIILAVGMLALFGCTHETSALYVPARKPAADPTDLPLLPSRPGEKETNETCEACAQDRCAAARNDCLEDDDCIDMLACKGTCSDPACLQRCDAKFAFSAWYEDLWICVFERACGVECKAGENFACAGQYDWPIATHSRFPVLFNFSRDLTSTAGLRFKSVLVGATVRVCVNSPCTESNVYDSGRVDSSNRVSLDLIADLTGRFPGFLEIEDPRSGYFGWKARVYPEPLAMETEVRLVLLDSYALQSQTNGLLDLDAGAPLVIEITDCLNFAARNVRFELPDLPDVEVGHFGEGIVYGAPATSVGLALVPDVPEAARREPIWGRAVQVGTDEIVAETLVGVHSGWTTELVLLPRTR